MYKEEKKLNPSVLIDWLNKGKVDAKALFTYFDKEGKEIPLSLIHISEPTRR